MRRMKKKTREKEDYIIPHSHLKFNPKKPFQQNVLAWIAEVKNVATMHANWMNLYKGRWWKLRF